MEYKEKDVNSLQKNKETEINIHVIHLLIIYLNVYLKKAEYKRSIKKS